MIKKNGLRKEILGDKLKEILDSIDFIEKEFPLNFENFNDRRMKNSIYKEIEFSIQNIIDICSIINADLRLGTPETEDTIFENVEKNKILSKNVVDKIREMKGFRNILVHKYGKINDEEAYDNIKEGLKDFELIINEIELFLKKN